MVSVLHHTSNVRWRKRLTRFQKQSKYFNNILDTSEKARRRIRMARSVVSVNQFGPTDKSKMNKKDEKNKRNGYLRLRSGNINTPVTFSRECLDAYNNKRRLHNIPKFQWSADLAREAQVRADELAKMNISDKIESVHRDENIYVDSFVDLSTSCTRAVETWYEESKKRYYTKSPKLADDTGLLHFYLYCSISLKLADFLRAPKH